MPQKPLPLLETQNPKPEPAVLPPLQPAYQQALKELGKTPLQFAFEHVEPSWQGYIRYVQNVANKGNLDARRYVDYWMRSGKPGQAGPPEQICEAAQVNPDHLIAWVAVEAAHEGTYQLGVMRAFKRAPAVKRMVDFAMDAPENFKHMELFCKVDGLLPVGRPGGTRIYNQPIAASGSVAGVLSESGTADRGGLRDMDSEVVNLSQILQTGSTVCAAEQSDEEDDDSEDDE
jgi:hypothetical protein